MKKSKCGIGYKTYSEYLITAQFGTIFFQQNIACALDRISGVREKLMI